MILLEVLAGQIGFLHLDAGWCSLWHMCVIIIMLSFSCLCSSLLQELLEKVVMKTEGYEVYQLEKLYALLCQSIYRHRRHYNKTALVQVSVGLC